MKNPKQTKFYRVLLQVVWEGNYSVHPNDEVKERFFETRQEAVETAERLGEHVKGFVLKTFPDRYVEEDVSNTDYDDVSHFEFRCDSDGETRDFEVKITVEEVSFSDASDYLNLQEDFDKVVKLYRSDD